MSMRQMHIRLSQAHIDILDEIILNTAELNGYSEAIRYMILTYGQSENKKMNIISKNIDILMEMVAGGFQSSNIQSINPKEDSLIYHKAKQFVEEDIQKAITKRAKHKNKKSE